MTEKILFINPNFNYPVSRWKNVPIFNRIWPPLSLANCAALLERENFDVEIIDANAERLTPDQLVSRTHDFDKVFVTSSSLDRWQCPHLNLNPFLEVVRKLRKNDSKLYVMGSHGTMRPKEILNMTKADAVIIGEPELTVLDICMGKRSEGLCFEENGNLIVKQRGKFLDLNDLPIPAFHLLPMKKYFYEVLGDNFTLFEGSRSCPFNCIFCFKKIYGKYRVRSHEKLIRDVAYAIENFDVKNAFFMDLEFLLDRRLVEKVCDFLIKGKFDFSWTCQTRFDTVNLELLKKMKKSGCELIHFGVETGSERILRMTNKKITLDKIQRGMELTKKVGIDSVCFFLFGLPTETETDMRRTIEFAKKLDPTYASFHVALPYPGTTFHEMIKNEIGKTNEILPLYYGEHSPEFLGKKVKRAFIEFYSRPSYIFSTLTKKHKLLYKQFQLFLSFIR